MDLTPTESIEELTRAMARGAPLDRSTDYLRSCGEVAERIGGTPENWVEIVDWAAKLAENLSRFED